jgi:hypothetical protein
MYLLPVNVGSQQRELIANLKPSHHQDEAGTHQVIRIRCTL